MRMCLRGCVCAVLTGVAGLTSSGCGLLHIPYLTSLPREPLRTIRLLGFEAREPLGHATVTATVQKHENWFKPMGRWGTRDPANPASDASSQSEDSSTEVLAHQQGPSFREGHPQRIAVSPGQVNS